MLAEWHPRETDVNISKEKERNKKSTEHNFLSKNKRREKNRLQFSNMVCVFVMVWFCIQQLSHMNVEGVYFLLYGLHRVIEWIFVILNVSFLDKCAYTYWRDTQIQKKNTWTYINFIESFAPHKKCVRISFALVG